MQSRFLAQLETLNTELINMGALCEQAISSAVKALENGDEKLISTTFEADAEIDRKEAEIGEICMRMLLKHQPVARDLRVISSAMKMISDMERIGDQASDIAEIVQFIASGELKGKIHIKDMAVAAIKMVTDSVESFVKKDLSLAAEVIEYDDIVDNLFSTVKEELVDVIAQNPKEGEQCIDLLIVAKYLERIGDHAVNVAEWVEYSISGVHRKAKDLF